MIPSDPKDVAQLEMLMFGAALLAIATRRDTRVTVEVKPSRYNTTISKGVVAEARALARAFVEGATEISDGAKEKQ